MIKKLKDILEKLPPWTLSVACFLAICWLTLAPHPLGDQDLPLFPGADKIVHGIMFGGFTLCMITDSYRRSGWPMTIRKIDYYAPIIASAFGIITEILQQSMDAGRSGDIWDFISDTLGAFLVAIACMIIQTKRKTN